MLSEPPPTPIRNSRFEGDEKKQKASHHCVHVHPPPLPIRTCLSVERKLVGVSHGQKFGCRDKHSGYFSLSPLPSTVSVATLFCRIDGHPVVKFRTQVESVENNVRCARRGSSAASKLGMMVLAYYRCSINQLIQLHGALIFSSLWLMACN